MDDPTANPLNPNRSANGTPRSMSPGSVAGSTGTPRRINPRPLPQTPPVPPQTPPMPTSTPPVPGTPPIAQTQQATQQAPVSPRLPQPPVSPQAQTATVTGQAPAPAPAAQAQSEAAAHLPPAYDSVPPQTAPVPTQTAPAQAATAPATAPAAAPQTHTHTHVPHIPHRAPKAVSAELAAPLQQSLKHIVDNSTHGGAAAAQAGHPPDAVHSHGTEAKSWIASFFPSSESVEWLFAYEHMGNYVIERTTGKRFFETMPLYVRVGMHLLFVSGAEFMTYKKIERLLEEQSIRQGEVYNRKGPEVRPHIESFIRAYALPLDELLVKDLDEYPTFNSFFARRLVAAARPITAPTDPTIITSPADCRMCVFDGVDSAKELWIKGEQFTIDRLLLGDDKKDKSFDAILNEQNVSIAVCRLAPQDYHRFHSPVDAECVYVKNIKGELYTVNPQAVNEKLDVFTMNKRSIMLLEANLGPGKERTPVAFVAVGALLVGSIAWSKMPGDRVAKGEEIGWFQYGGSTVILVFPSSAGVKFDDDLRATSKQRMETLVRVGMEIATVATTTA